MRNVARLKMGYYPLPESEGIKIRALLSFPLPASVIDPCVGQGTALHLVTGNAEVKRYGVELDAERSRIATSKGIETIHGNAFDAIAKPESFSLLYLNPPYDSEIGSVANRRMERLFLDHTYRWLVPEGVLVLVIPFERLYDCVGVLGSHFGRLSVLRMESSLKASPEFLRTTECHQRLRHSWRSSSRSWQLPAIRTTMAGAERYNSS